MLTLARLRQLACSAIAIAALGGTGAGLVSGSVHTGIFYGVAVLTGMFAGFWLERQVR
jgi:hypothetical protein